jgi:hypothetical protein
MEPDRVIVPSPPAEQIIHDLRGLGDLNHDERRSVELILDEGDPTYLNVQINEVWF